MSDNYQDFLEQKHREKFNTSESVINEIIKEVTGTLPLTIKKLVKGESNEVYEFKAVSGQDLILRLSKSEGEKFEKEKWVMEQCAKVGIPVSKTIYIKRAEFEGSYFQVSIQEKLLGSRLDEIGDLLEPSQQLLLEDLLIKSGEMISKMHSIKTNGFGDIDGQGNCKKSSIQDLLLDPYFSGDQLVSVAEKENIDSELVRLAVQTLRQEAEKYVLETPSLIHRDLGPDHIFALDGSITGLIDFESAEGGDPIADLARWDNMYSKKYPLALLMKGYANKELFNEQFDRKLAMWKLYWNLGGLSYSSEEQNQHGIDLIRESLTKNIQFFQV